MSFDFDVNETGLEPGILLLEASAGTGKTWSLTSIAVRLLLEGRVDSIDRLLLVTFTRAATDELRRRLRDRLHQTERILRGEAPDESDAFLDQVALKWGDDLDALKTIMRARRDVDQARVRTIHGFCLEVLADGAFEAGLPLDGPGFSEGDELLRTAFRDTIRALVLDDLPFVGAAIRILGIDPDQGSHWNILNKAKRRIGDRWCPELRPLDEVIAELESAVDGMDFALLGSFVEGGPLKDWRTADRNEQLRAMKLLAGGFDRSDPRHHAALFLLEPALLRKNLTVKGNVRFDADESALESMLEAVGKVLDEVLATLPQVVYRQTLDRYTELKENHASIDHDDVIARTRERLADPVTGDALVRRIAGAFDAALVDEFQDTDSDQWEIFRRLFTVSPPRSPEHLLLLVGDPKQAIYRFRGADIFAYLQARRAADRTATLTHNWRSTPALVDAVNTVFGRQPDQSFALEEIGFTPVRPGRKPDPENACPMELVCVDEEPGTKSGELDRIVLDQLAVDIIRRREEIDRLPEDDSEPRTLAVLVRTHRQSRDVMRVLRAVGIDAVLARGGDIHQSEAMAEWRVLLRSLLDPSDLSAQRRTRATRIWGARLSGLGEGAATWNEVGLFNRLRKTWTDYGVAAMAAELLSERRTVARWLGEVEGERLVTDLRHGLELLNREESMRGLGPEALVRWAEAESRSDARESDERPLRLDRQSDAVQILTSFTSKGLQYDTVYLPHACMAPGLPVKLPAELHDPQTGAATLDFAGEERLLRQATLEEIASQLRLHYVELTRAKERCVVYLTPRTSFPGSAAAFLLARDEREVGDDRAAWAVSELENLSGSLRESFGRIEAVAHAATSIAFRTAETVGRERTVWPRPRIRWPQARDYPPARRGALYPWRQLSYTSLVNSLRDRLDDDPVGFDLPLADRSDPADSPVVRSAAGIFGFARGARAGICLHELLEKAEFTRDTNADDRHRVEALLDRHGLGSPDAHPGEIDPLDVALELIEQVRREELPYGARPFSQLEAVARLDEWEFRLPVVDLVPREMAQLVSQHWNGEAWVDIAARRLARLPAQKLQGMLGGFIDLLFVEDGRWTVLDWKSNDLGADPSHYTRDAMQRAMVEHDYLVQVLFYTLAVHRFLRMRIADYDYDRHVAGASYVFLRGLSGDPDRGWCNARPPRALIDALDDLFAGGGK